MKTFRFLICCVFLFVLTQKLTAQDAEVTSNPIRVSFKAKDIIPPNIFLVYRNAGLLTPEGKVYVDIRVLDEGGLGSVTINDEKLNGNKQDSLVITYQFEPGQEINIEARDIANNVKEKSFIIKGPIQPVVSDASLQQNVVVPKHKYYALLMGIEKYDDSEINPLTEPIKDAGLLKQVLVSKYTFEEQDITFLKNPTGDEIQIAFEELSNKVTPNDFVLIFYAGHGYFDEKRDAGYWFPRDARKSNTARWFRNSTLVEDIGAIPAKHTLLISDACFSGGIFLSRAPFNNASLDISNNLKRQSRKAMTSGSLTTVPDKSVFMKYLLQILNDNDNKYLSSEELFEQLKPIVRNNSDTEPRYGEIKNTHDEGGIFYFIKKS